MSGTRNTNNLEIESSDTETTSITNASNFDNSDADNSDADNSDTETINTENASNVNTTLATDESAGPKLMSLYLVETFPLPRSRSDNLKAEGPYVEVAEHGFVAEHSAIYRSSNRKFARLVWDKCLGDFVPELRNMVLDNFFRQTWTDTPPLLIALCSSDKDLEKNQVYHRYGEALKSFNRTGTFLLSHGNKWEFGRMSAEQIASIHALEIDLNFLCWYNWLEETFKNLDVGENLKWHVIVITQSQMCNYPNHRALEAGRLNTLLRILLQKMARLERIEYHTGGFVKKEDRRIWDYLPEPARNTQPDPRCIKQKRVEAQKLDLHLQLIAPLIEIVNNLIDVPARLERVSTTGNVVWFWDLEMKKDYSAGWAQYPAITERGRSRGSTLVLRMA